MLTIHDHRRDPLLKYVYPVVSRRAGGLSLGINLNPNSACNWQCCYCQVEDLQRGSAPNIDLQILADELDLFLDKIYRGDYLERAVPEWGRELKDIAFSGDGEPTSSIQFFEIIKLVRDVSKKWNEGILLRLITNGSFLHRQTVQNGIKLMASKKAEIWFKYDRGSREAMKIVNGISYAPHLHLEKLRLCSQLANTWLQTCWFCIDQQPPSLELQNQWIRQIKPYIANVQGVHLYGIARTSYQAQSARLSQWNIEDMKKFAERITDETGLIVSTSA